MSAIFCFCFVSDIPAMIIPRCKLVMRLYVVFVGVYCCIMLVCILKKRLC